MRFLFLPAVAFAIVFCVLSAMSDVIADPDHLNGLTVASDSVINQPNQGPTSWESQYTGSGPPTEYPARVTWLLLVAFALATLCHYQLVRAKTEIQE